MDNDKIETLLLQLVQDMAYVKARLEVMEDVQTEYKELNNKIEKLEMQSERHEKQLKSVERRADVMEQFVRNGMSETNKTNKGVFISVALCVVTAFINIVFSLFQ